MVRLLLSSFRDSRLIEERVSLVVALLNWISETPAQRNTQATPGYLSFGMAGECASDLHIDDELTVSDSTSCWCGMLDMLHEVEMYSDTEQGYMPLFLPPPPNARMATGTGAAPPMPQQ